MSGSKSGNAQAAPEPINDMGVAGAESVERGLAKQLQETFSNSKDYCGLYYRAEDLGHELDSLATQADHDGRPDFAARLRGASSDLESAVHDGNLEEAWYAGDIVN